MANRKFHIWIKRDYEWHIRDLGYLGELWENDKDCKQINGLFLGNSKIKDNKIVYLFDPFLTKEELEIAKNEPLFQEICDFEITITNAKWENKTEYKTMSIYKALCFIFQKREELEKQSL